MTDGHKQFTYRLVPVTHSDDFSVMREESWLKDMGLAGWELCASEWGHLIFKREIIEFL